jgi:Adenylate and Guanylate cyclase catalytic domain
VLFLDVVGSTQIASDLGDRRWRELLTRFRRSVRVLLKRYDGHEEDTAGDGFFATFPAPEQAVRAADAIVRAVQVHGVDVRCGVHFGECEIVDGRLAGIAVHIGSRVMSLAGPAEVLVTSTVRDLVAGSGMVFEDLSAHELKGVPGTWQLFALREMEGEPVLPPLTGAAAAERLAEVVPPGAARRRRPVFIGAGAVIVAGVAVWAILASGGGGEHPSATGSPSHPVAPASASASGPSSPTPPPLLSEAVVRLDLDTGKVRVVAKDVLNGGLGNQRFMSFGEGAAWVSGSGVVRIDPKTGAIRRFNSGGGNVEAADGQVWAATATGVQNAFRPAALRIDPADFTQHLELFPGTFPSVLAKVAIGAGSVWLVYEDQVWQYDPGHDTKVEVPHAGHVDLVVAYGQEVWAEDFLNGVLRQIDPNRSAVEQTVPLQVAPDAVAVGPAGLWYVSTAGGVAFSVDEVGATVGTPVKVGAGPVDVAVGTHVVWVANRDDDTVTRIDVDTTRTMTFAVPGSPVAIAVDPRTDTPWVYLG